MMLDVVGVGWPNVDEDAYRDMADVLREFAEDADDDGHTAHGQIQRLTAHGTHHSYRSGQRGGLGRRRQP
ncbi:hypothetical protein ACFU76_29190 [Streptomyces sp. NPDC057539]|uniref:hypothetical protein n=1 Tax=Streptomyces sp. NPDC057539 TaxID=3346159 RepID=UPI0036B56B36